MRTYYYIKHKKFGPLYVVGHGAFIPKDFSNLIGGCYVTHYNSKKTALIDLMWLRKNKTNKEQKNFVLVKVVVNKSN